MSINFNDDMNGDAKNFIAEAFKDHLEDFDDRTVLLKDAAAINQKQMKELANLAKQVVTVELNEIGDTKEVNGKKYVLNEIGWIRCDAEGNPFTASELFK